MMMMMKMMMTTTMHRTQRYYKSARLWLDQARYRIRGC